MTEPAREFAEAMHTAMQGMMAAMHGAAMSGVTFDNTGDEPLVVLRYFGPGVNPGAPKIGDAKKRSGCILIEGPHH